MYCYMEEEEEMIMVDEGDDALCICEFYNQVWTQNRTAMKWASLREQIMFSSTELCLLEKKLRYVKGWAFGFNSE